jgi:hypothetical protein
MVVGLAPRVGKVVHPCMVLIYCNSLAPGSRSTLMKFVSDCHIHPAGAGNVGECWRSLQTSACGVLWVRTSLLHLISLYISAAI